MIAVIAEHLKTHRHQLGKHALFIGSAVRIPPVDRFVSASIERMALAWAGERVADLEGPQQTLAALDLMAEGMPDHTDRIRLLRDELGPEARPAEGHVRLSRLIKDGYYSTVFITEPDDMLERALHAQHMEPEKDYHRLVAGVDEPDDIKVALDESTRVAIVKCGGDLEQRFLPISPAEVGAVADEIGPVLDDTFKTFSVFVAMVGRDDPFLNHVPHEGARVFWINTLIPMADAELYDELKMENPASAEFHKLQPHVMELLEARQSSRHLLCREPGSFNEFFAKLHTRLIRQRRRRKVGKGPDLTVLRGGPYRFLNYFDVEDTDFYFGREDDVKALLEKIETNPTTVVFGKTAIGKTSLLRAGLMAALRQESEEADKEQTHPWLIAYARVGDDPVAGIRDAVVAAVEAAGYNAADIAQRPSLPEVVVGAAELCERKVIVMLDQFAEYFVKLGRMVRDSFKQALRECLDQCGERFRLVIAIREDYLGELFELQDDLPEIMQNMHRLRVLTREQAEDAILKPAQNFELQIERGLMQRIVDDLYREGVEPAKLQIVCHSLYEAKSRGGRFIGSRIYDRLEGAQGILDNYLDRALAQIPNAEKRVASTILTFMAGGSELKAAQPIDRVVANANGERDLVDRVLAHLVDVGLLRSVGKGRQREFELVHEILADKIQEDLAGEQVMLRDVQDVLTRAMNSYTQFGLLIGAEDLRLIGAARDELSIAPEELRLIIRSALTAEVDEDYWFERVSDLEERAAESLATLMRDDAPQVRLGTYSRLKDHLEPKLIRHLVHGIDDDLSEVRSLAKTHLAQLEGHLVSMLEHEDHRVRALAARALGHIESRKSVRLLVEAFEDGSATLRDELTNALLEIDEPRAPDMLLKAVSAAPHDAWAAAYALGRLSLAEDDLKHLNGAADARRKPELHYAAGVALTHRRSYPEAAEALAQARELVHGEPGPTAIEEAEQELHAQRQRAAAGEDAWTLFGRSPAHGAYTAEQVTPPLELAWEFKTKDHVVASPVVRDNTAYIGSRDEHFYAVDTGKGTARWSFEADDRIEGAAALAHDLVCFATLGGGVHALDIASGEERWSTPLGSAIRSGCTLDGDALYLGTRDGALVRLEAATGEVKWRAQTPGEISATAAVADAIVVAGCWDGYIYAFRAEDGSELWRLKTQAPVSSSPAISDGVVYCGSDDHGLYAMDLATGEQLWRAGLGGQVRSSPAVGGHVVVVGSIDGRCYALARENGRILWTAETEEEIMSSPAISGDIVYFGSKDGALYAASLTDGEILWREHAAYGVYSSPAVAEQTVFVGFAYYSLAAFRPKPE